MKKRGEKQQIDGIHAANVHEPATIETPPVKERKNRKIQKFANHPKKENKPKALQKEKTKPKKKIKLTPHHRLIHNIKIALTVLATILVLNLLFLGGVVFGYPQMYKDRVLPGVFVLGEEMGGTYKPELKKLVREKLSNNKIYFKIGEKEESVSLSELGVTVNSDKVSENAYKTGRTGNFWKDSYARISSFVYFVSAENHDDIMKRQSVSIPYKVDSAKVSEYSKGVFERYKTPEKNASVIIKGADVEVLPAQYGEKVITGSLENQINQALETMKSGEKVVVSLSKEKITPSLKEEGLTATVAKTREITGKNITLKFEDKKYAVSKESIASWIAFDESNNTFTPKVDQAKVEGYVQTIAPAINIASEPKKIKVENGVKETVAAEGKEGRALLVKETAGKVKSSLESGQKSASVDLIVAKVPPKIVKESVLVANWDKYIDLDLTNQTMTAYLKDGVVVNSWKITSGKNATPTPVGTWLVHNKTAVTRMTGGTRGVDYYDLPNVHWVTWFKGGGYAIHEAYWRSVFGGQDYKWAGSHGCVNASYDVAKFIYDWAPVGTPVIVHY